MNHTLNESIILYEATGNEDYIEEFKDTVKSLYVSAINEKKLEDRLAKKAAKAEEKPLSKERIVELEAKKDRLAKKVAKAEEKAILNKRNRHRIIPDRRVPIDRFIAKEALEEWYIENGYELDDYEQGRIDMFVENFITEKSNFDKYIDLQAKKINDHYKKEKELDKFTDITTSKKDREKFKELARKEGDKAYNIKKSIAGTTEKGSPIGPYQIKDVGDSSRKGYHNIKDDIDRGRTNDSIRRYARFKYKRMANAKSE